MNNYIITRDENPDELQHYGVLGMTCGVRRASKSLSNATTKEKKAKVAIYL